MDVRMDHIRFSYGEKEIFGDYSLLLKSGEAYLLTGPSGCGKTTLLHLLTGLLKPGGGTVTEGVRFGTVFQENRLLPGYSAVENLRFACPGHSQHSVKAFLGEILPEDCIQAPVESLSGGMARRVAIARALLSASDVLVMDEPFTGLDEGTLETVLEFVKKYRNGRTLLVSTHHPDELSGFSPKHIRLGPYCP